MYENSMLQRLGGAQADGLAELGAGMAMAAAHEVSKKYALDGSAHFGGESLIHLGGMDVSAACVSKTAVRNMAHQGYQY